MGVVKGLVAEQTRSGNQPPAWWMGEDRLFCRLQFGQLTGAPGWCRGREQARKREREREREREKREREREKREREKERVGRG